MTRERGFTAEWLATTTARIERFRAGTNTDAPDRQRVTAGVAKPSGAKVPKPLERDIQAAVLEVLSVHPKVAFAYRFNTGAATFRGADDVERFVKFAFKGCADVLGMLKGGRFLACECKRFGEHPTPDQQAFLLSVARGGGLAFVARSVDDVLRALA